MCILLLSSLLFANGLTTHCWISAHAISLLPDGELKSLLTDPNLELYWRNGTMFPDGGYPQGDNYGEMAHWEPFQMAYLEWIKSNYDFPLTNEASQHVAFLLGMTSHGLADQTFDSMYMTRAWVYDSSADWSLSMDTATDVIFSSLTGPQPVPESWIPDDPFVSLFEEQGHLVDISTLENGQNLVRTAVTWVGSAGQTDELVDLYEPQFPWANTNLLSEVISGAPPVEAELVAEYWMLLWERLNEMEQSTDVIRVFPSETDYSHPLDADSIESRISIVFARGLNIDTVSEESFSIQHSDGTYVPLVIDVYYGMNSHVVHLFPIADFRANSDYTISVDAGIEYFDGMALTESQFFNFTTKDPPPVPSNNSKVDERGCNSASSHRSSVWLIIVGLMCLRTRRVLVFLEKKSHLECS
ncbi:MAG: Ig-like domain-containing protein [Myxococcota bacterium]|nr:Ig-like domain-containing protein [Myxococcota bacterium]